MMEAPGKRKRGNDAGDDGGYLSGDQDRLSALPDSLLREIMSHMKARQVVQTCVLSRRWRHLWRSMTCVDVKQADFSIAGAYQYADYDGWEKFEDFMDTLLSPGNVNIALLDTLRLHTSYGGGGLHDKRQRSRWIRRGIKYPHAQDIGVQRGRLSYNSWRLRRLHRTDLYLCNLFGEHVRTRCRSLEDLQLSSCDCDFHAIASDSLKDLVLRCCKFKGLSEIATPVLKCLSIESGRNSKDCLLVITAPALASVFLGVTPYNFNGGLSLSEKTTLSLAKASMRLADNKIVDRFKMLGSSMSNVITNLEVSLAGQTMLLNEGSTTFLLQFNNLRTLVLYNCDLSDDFQILGHFLRNSPSLERLTLRRCKYSNDTKKKKGAPKSKNPCPDLVDVRCENLKLTEIIYQEDDIRQLIELLLRISGNLPNNCIKLIKVG